MNAYSLHGLRHPQCAKAAKLKARTIFPQYDAEKRNALMHPFGDRNATEPTGVYAAFSSSVNGRSVCSPGMRDLCPRRGGMSTNCPTKPYVQI